MLRIAIIGTGAIAGAHISAIAKLDDISLVALCDVNEERVKALAEENNVPYFLNYKEIPASIQCDAVIINLPHGLHAPATIFFLENGIHVLVEKPMANTVTECDAMNEAALKNGKKLGIAHIQKYFPVNKKIKSIIDSGELGRLCMYNEQRSINYFLPNRSPWFTDKKMAGGGIVMNYGAHAFDRLCYTTGSSIKDVCGICNNFLNDRDVEGHAQIIALLANGVSATVTFSAYSAVDYLVYYYFTNGALRATGTSKLEIIHEGEKKWTPVEVEPYGNEFVEEIRDFHKYVKGEASDIPNYEYSRAIIDAITRVYGDNVV